MDTVVYLVTQVLVARFLPRAMAASRHVVLVTKLSAELHIEYLKDFQEFPENTVQNLWHI
jgi:hypothetical protein